MPAYGSPIVHPKTVKLHREQYDFLPEDERYTGTESVEGLLEKKASGEILDGREENYLKIFANLHDYERATANGRLRNILFPKIQEALEKAGIDVQNKEYLIEMDIYGKITVTGELSEEEKRKAADVLEEQFADAVRLFCIRICVLTAAVFHPDNITV